MDVRAAKFLLWSVAAALGACAAGVVVWSVGRVEVPSAAAPPAPVARSAGGATALPPLSAFEPLWGLDLRRPWAETAAAPGPATGAAAAGAPAGPRLLGTVVEPGHSMAMFATAAGAEWKTEWKVVGDEVGGGRVLAIDDNSATVELDGRPVVVALEKPGAGPAANSAGPGAGGPDESAAARNSAEAGAGSAAPMSAAAQLPAAPAAGAPSAPTLVPMPDYEEPH